MMIKKPEWSNQKNKKWRRLRCSNCTMRSHNQEYSPSMNKVFVKIIHGKQHKQTVNWMHVGWFCKNCGTLEELQ